MLHKFLDVCCLISCSVFKDHSRNLSPRARQYITTAELACQQLFLPFFRLTGCLSAECMFNLSLLLYLVKRFLKYFFELSVFPLISGEKTSYFLHKEKHTSWDMCLSLFSMSVSGSNPPLPGRSFPAAGDRECSDTIPLRFFRNDPSCRKFCRPVK